MKEEEKTEEVTEEGKKRYEFAEEICATLRKNLFTVRIVKFDPSKSGPKPKEIILTLRVGRKKTI
ncbi:unnamed protein product [marine sediment metagenome]|uniref:Uncharacterized protein n=1 Tax=marine sediment metagenome TaxID=412755 RepID=X1MBR0_9ZZZZ